MVEASLCQHLRAAARGDPRAWDPLVLALGPRMHAAACRILGDIHDADDACQEAVFALGRAAASFRGEDEPALGRWAVAIACRSALLHARRQLRRAALVRTGLPDGASNLSAASAPEGTDPMALDAARRALEKLPHRHRLPIVLHVFGGLDGMELAHELGISVNAARVRLHRALKRLQRLFLAEGVGATPMAACAALAARPCPPPSLELLARCHPPPSPRRQAAPWRRRPACWQR